MEQLTDRQREVFNFMRDFYHEHGYPPTIYEIGDHFGFSAHGANCHIEVLVKKGVITRVVGKKRTIRFAKQYFSVRLGKSCPDGYFQAGDDLIVCRTTRPVAGDTVVVGEEDKPRFEVFRGQKPILGKVVGLCREVS